MNLRGDQMPFGGTGTRSRPGRILFYLGLIVAGVMLTRLVEAGRVQPLFLPTPTPTRTTFSYAQEAETHFAAGALNKAIEAYQKAVELNPEDDQSWADLARIQTYSSSLLATAEERRARLSEARDSIENAVEIAPDSVENWAVRILVYDWSASAADDVTDRQRFFNEAESSMAQANILDPNNALAVAYEAELRVDRGEFAPALDKAQQAIQLADPDNLTQQMDVHRVYGTVLENNGLYRQAIDEYLKAAEINENLTFLYLRIGANYRRLQDSDNALRYFERAARLNEQNQISDPIPYLAIGRTYLQDGEFFIAARNLEQAVAIAPANAELFGFLGIVYFKARNYESAETVLRCAVNGCAPEVGRELLCQKVYGCELDDEEAQQYGEFIAGLPLEAVTLEYYYTLGSVLASNNQCQDAEQIFSELIASYGSDPIVSAIVAEGRLLCANQETQPPLEASPTSEINP
jgi:tetratricopeptide (TPR) repeat protein